MANQYKNKIVYNGQTLIDLTRVTVTPQVLSQGYTAIDASGRPITGTMTGGAVIIRDSQDTHGGTIREITATDVVKLQGGKTVNPTESSQTVTPDTGYDAFESVSVEAISSTYVGSGITRRSSSDLTASGATVTVPSGYYSAQATKAVSSGTAGTPSATKGTVSNHSVSITPTVTNTTGYITGGTKNGTAVTVSASELVSGSQTITQNNTYDVTTLAEVVVNVAGGGSSGLEYETGTWSPVEDTASPTISFANTHSLSPMFVMMSIVTAPEIETYSIYTYVYADWYRLTGAGFPYDAGNMRYGLYRSEIRTSSTTSTTNSAALFSHTSDETGDTVSYPSHHVTNTVFTPYCGGTNRYWRSGETYKWIAVWAPTS